MAPRFNNSRVVWAFSGVGDVTNAGGEEFLECGFPGMEPSVISLDASWGFGTAYEFDLDRDFPAQYYMIGYDDDRRGTRLYYYSFDDNALLSLRNKIQGRYSSASQRSIIFRAEYVCNCPGASVLHFVCLVSGGGGLQSRCLN